MLFYNSFYKNAFAISLALPLSLAATSLMATSVFAQEITETAVTETAVAETAVAETVTLPEAVQSDLSVQDFFPTQQLKALSDAATLLVEPETVRETVQAPIQAPIQVPGAAAIGSLESVGLADGLALEAAELDLVAISEGLGVEADSVPALTAALDSDNVLTQLYAADALWTMTGDRDLVLPTLVQAATVEQDQVRVLAISALTQMGKQALPALPALNNLLTNPDARTRSLAQDAIAVIRSDNRSSTVRGIVFREARRRLLPAAIRVITDLWR